MVYVLEVEPGDPRSIAIAESVLRAHGIEMTFKPILPTWGPERTFEVARVTLEAVGDLVLLKEGFAAASAQWPGFKARVVELTKGGRHKRGKKD